MRQSLLVEAWRDEARLYRRDGKEQAALRLERLADKVEKRMKARDDALKNQAA